jgi:flagellar biosynthesis protein FlhG
MKHSLPSKANPIRVLAVASGKGGVGKTNASLNLSMALVLEGHSVLLVDADLGMANIHVMLNLRPKFDLFHVLNGEKSLEEVIIEGPAGLSIIPASSGVSKMANLDNMMHAGLLSAFEQLERPTDYIIIDTAAGISNSVVSFSGAASEVVVVVCDEPASLTDAYALIKVLSQEYGVQRFQILANMVNSSIHGKKIYAKISSVVDKFLNVSLSFLGSIPQDNLLKKAVQNQTSVMTYAPHSPSAIAFQGIAKKISTSPSSLSSTGSLEILLNKKKFNNKTFHELGF